MKHILGDNYSKYPVTQKFLNPNSDYMSGFHMGTDFATPSGTPVYAPLAGNIVQCFDNNPSMGNAIIYQCVKDGLQYQLRIMHLTSFSPVASYQEGDIVAYTGNTGMSTGPHLHVDVSKNAVDWQGIKTLDGIISNMVDYEKWSEQIDFNYKVAVSTPIPAVEPEIAPTVNVFNKEELMSHVNTFIALFITIALPQIQTFDWQNATKASLIALLGVIVRAVVKALSEKYITAKLK